MITANKFEITPKVLGFLVIAIAVKTQANECNQLASGGE